MKTSMKKKEYAHRQINKKMNGGLILAGIVLVIVVIGLIFVNTNKEGTTVQERILKTATREAKSVSAENVHTCSLDKEGGYFTINEKEYPYFGIEKEMGEQIPECDIPLPDVLEEYLEEARSLTIDFAREQFQPELAEEIVSEMIKTPMVVGDFSISETLQGSAFVYEAGKIWVNPEVLNQLEYLPKELCIFTLVHEWLHMITDITLSDEAKVTKYLYSSFNEGMTDIIANAIYPHFREDGRGYNSFYPFAYLFIDAYKEAALDAYFFGYTTLFEKKMLTEERMDIFCFLTDMSDERLTASGLSNIQAYEMLTGQNLAKIKKMAKGILVIPS